MKLYRAVSVAAFVLGACTTEKIQYVNRPPFTAGKDTANGFLGYFTINTQQTSCGNCHVGLQATWKTTKHAQAWANLQKAGEAHQGKVVLRGRVHSWAERDAAEGAAWAAQGVATVDNRLHVVS